MKLRRFWFEFEPGSELPMGLSLGCGATARDYDDAIQLMRDTVFAGREVPSISRSIEDVDVSELDPDHVRPNMGNVTARGIWFPLGYH